jgi:hypothetical protein
MRKIGKILAVVALSVASFAVGSAYQAHQASKAPLGVTLQRDAGSQFEVIFDPSTGMYTIEPV